MKQKRNRLVLLLLLLLAAIAAYFFLNKKKTVTPEKFTQQGQTEINAGNVTLKVWDNNTEDGDSVRVYFKEKLIVDSLPILYTPIEYKLGYLKAGEYWLGVSAINEGMTSPASASISLVSNGVEREFEMDAWIDSAASWKVIVK